MPRCNARRPRHPGLRCRRHGNKRNGRCYFHGGNSTGPKTAEGLKRAAVARMSGVAKWRQSMHDAVSLGIIPHVPWYGWNRPKGLYGQVYVRTKEAAMAIIENELEKLPEPTDKPLDEQTMGELLAGNARLALMRGRQILSIECADDNYKLMSIHKDLIATTITTQVRVDEGAMRKQSADWLPALLQRIQEIRTETAAIEQANPQLLDVTPEDDELPL